MTRSAGALLLAALAALDASAQSPAPAAPPAASSATPVRSARLADLAWIAGHWVDDSSGDLSEEVWMEPAGESMTGMWRYVSKGRLAVQELLSIADEGGRVVLRLRHFDPKLVAREEKASPVSLPLVSWKAGEAVFEGPGQPSGTVRLTYRRPSPDTLAVTLEKDGGAPQPFRFRRKKK